jgi:hypothetical protein
MPARRAGCIRGEPWRSVSIGGGLCELGKDFLRHIGVDTDERKRLLAGPGPTGAPGCDVHSEVAQDCADLPDHARLVATPGHQDRAFGADIYPEPVHIHYARLIVAEQCGRDGASATAPFHPARDDVRIVGRMQAGRLGNDDAPLHCDVGSVHVIDRSGGGPAPAGP